MHDNEFEEEPKFDNELCWIDRFWNLFKDMFPKIGFLHEYLKPKLPWNKIVSPFLLEICNFGQSFSTRKYKKTHLHHYRIPRKRIRPRRKNNNKIEDPKIRSRP